jgi:hypothetical protein
MGALAGLSRRDRWNSRLRRRNAPAQRIPVRHQANRSNDVSGCTTFARKHRAAGKLCSRPPRHENRSDGRAAL